MALRFDAAQGLRHDALGTDDEGRALDPEALLSVHHLLLHHAVGAAHGLLLVGKERNRKFLLRLEAAVRRDGIARDAENAVAELREVVGLRREVAGLERAARRAVLRVEIENHAFAAKRGKRHFAFVGGQREVGRDVAFADRRVLHF